MEETLVAACLAKGREPLQPAKGDEGVSCEDLLDLECELYPPLGGLHNVADMPVHHKLLVLLSRHTQALTAKAQAHSSLHPDDEIAAATAPELTVILALLQGLCLLSSACQLACAEEWVMEVRFEYRAQESGHGS